MFVNEYSQWYCWVFAAKCYQNQVCWSNLIDQMELYGCNNPIAAVDARCIIQNLHGKVNELLVSLRPSAASLFIQL